MKSNAAKGYRLAIANLRRLPVYLLQTVKEKLYMFLEAANCRGTFFFSPNPDPNLARVSDLQFGGKAGFW